MKRQKSLFKRLCDKYRIDYSWPEIDGEKKPPGITIEEMAKELGYTDEKGNGKQSHLSQLENNPKGPPLEFVEKYANCFKLDSVQKFDLFYAALESSKEIKLDVTALRPLLAKTFFQFVVAMILCKEIFSPPGVNEHVPFSSKDTELIDAWTKLLSAVENFADAVKKYPLAYRPDSKTADISADTDLEKHKKQNKNV
jgi:transcriptional regulator with XRE-family HTH domain